MILTIDECELLQAFLGKRNLEYFENVYSVDYDKMNSVRARRYFGAALESEGYNLRHLIVVAKEYFE
jgi:hypothetical protein